MKSRRRATSSLFRKAASAQTLRPPVRFSRGGANASWNPAGVFSGRAVNLLLLIVVVLAVVAALFVGIPKLVGDDKKKERERPGLVNPSAPDAKK